MKLYLENVRSFEGWHEIDIAPTTILVGENSAGKSTLLGLLSVALTTNFFNHRNLFNQAPFELGSYKTIASSKRGTKRFSVGIFQNFNDSKTHDIGFVASFRDDSGLPSLCHLLAWQNEMSFSYSESEEEYEERSKNAFQDIHNRAIRFLFPENDSDERGKFNFHDLRRQILESNEKKNREFNKSKDKNTRSRFDLDDLFHYVVFGLGPWRGFDTIAFAPMRSRPKRTYDQLTDDFSPEGDHVPMLLARLSDPNNTEAKALHDSLKSFGEYSGMFSDVEVKQLGKGSGDPFQVQVKVGKQKPNLVDVGYGVSQVLPLLVDAVRARPRTTLLLQQPEVHLHPKAQAALGSMFKDWVVKGKKTIVAETHSDYILDRIRLEVKRKQLQPEQVIIYYLEKEGIQTVLHKIKVDQLGNLLNTPQGYREFFLREKMALLADD